MSHPDPNGGALSINSGQRRGDRRKADRRRQDRRSPAPLWRRPMAYVAYGVAGALAVSLLLRLDADDAPDRAATMAIVDTPAAPADRPLPPVANVPARDAYTAAEYEELIAEGESAVGQIVRTEVFCGSITSIQVREIEGVNAALTALADADGRVAAAECRWGRDARSDDLLLVVPPALAEQFASAPVEEMSFVMRRRIPARVEWLGRSEALALRYAAVLREIEGTGTGTGTGERENGGTGAEVTG